MRLFVQFIFLYIFGFYIANGLYLCEWHSDSQPFNHVIWKTTENEIYLQWRYPRKCAVQYNIQGMKNRYQGTTIKNEIRIINLKADHEYELLLECLFCVRNRHSYRSPPFSIKLRTKALHPLPPSHLRVTNLTKNSICVAWSAPLELKPNENIESYYLLLSTRAKDNRVERWEFNITATHITQKCMGGLPAGVGFNAVMRLHTDQYRFSNFSQGLFVKTMDALSGPVVTYLVRPVETGPMWISLYWRPPLKSNGVIFMYLLILHDNTMSKHRDGRCIRAIALQCSECLSGKTLFNDEDFATWKERLHFCAKGISSLHIIKHYSHMSRILNANITLLRPHTEYVIHIYPVNRAGLGAVQVIKAKTYPLEDHSMEELQVFPTSSRAIYIQWRPSVSSDSSDIILYFVTVIDTVTMQCNQSLVLTCQDCSSSLLANSPARIHYKDLLQYCSYHSFLNYHREKAFFNVTITNLRPFSRYEVNVYSISASKLKGKQKVVIVTPQDVPGSPQNLSLLGSSGTTLRISWKPPKTTELNGIIRRYNILVTSSSDYQHWGVVRAPGATVLVLKGVEECRIYCSQVWAETSVGRGNGSRLVCHNQIVADVPAMQIERVNITVNDDNTIKLVWEKQIIGNCSLGFIVKMSDIDDNKHFMEKVTTSTELNFEDAKMGHGYIFKIRYFTGGITQENFMLSPWSLWSSEFGLPKPKSIIRPASVEGESKLNLSCNQTIDKCYSIRCNWMGVNVGNSSNIHYEIAYRRDTQFTWTRLGLKYELSNINSYEITDDLISGELYDISLELRINNVPKMTSHSSVLIQKLDCVSINPGYKLKILMASMSSVLMVILLIFLRFMWKRRIHKRLSANFTDTSEIVYHFRIDNNEMLEKEKL